MSTEERQTDSSAMNPEMDGTFSAQLNRKVMGGWLVATCVAVCLEAAVLISGVGNIIDWLLLTAFLAVSAVVAKHVFDKRPVLIVNREGVHDRRISARMISWEAMLWHKMEAHVAVPVLGVGLTDEAAKKAGVYPWSFLYKNQPAPFGKLKGYRIWAYRTLGEGQDFVRAVQRFAPAKDDG